MLERRNGLNRAGTTQTCLSQYSSELQEGKGGDIRDVSTGLGTIFTV